MIDSKTIDLIIRAQLKGKNDLASITKSIADLEKALQAQSEAAKRGESSIDGLKATMLALESVQKSIKTNASLVKEFEALPSKIDRATNAVTKAREAYEKLEAKQKDSGKVTEEQAQKLFDLNAKYQGTQQTLDKLLNRQAALRKELTDLGADTQDLATYQTQLLKTSADLGLVYDRANTSVKNYGETVAAAREATRAAAKAQKDAARDAELFEAAQTRAAAAEAAREADRKKYLNGPSESIRQAVSQSNEAEVNRAREIARQRELADLQNAITKRTNEQSAAQAKAQSELNATLKKTADDTETAVRSYNTLSQASASLVPATASLRNVIQSIADPSRESMTTLDGVDKAVFDLSKTIGQIDGPVKNYRETLIALNTVQRELANKAALIDTYNQQAQAVKRAEEEYAKATAKVAEYAAAVRQGGESGQLFVASLAQAQAAAKRAADALATERTSADAAKQSLDKAGISSTNLAASQDRLTNTAKQAKTSSDQLAAAVKQFGTESESAGKKNDKLFGDGGRTTLSLMQRIRGEILSLTASYVGLQGAISLAGNSLDAYNKRQATKTVIGVGLGTMDKQAIDEDYKYVRQQSDRIGLVFEDTAKQYGKFAAAAALAGRGRQEIKYIFETFAEGGRVLGLTTDDLNGVFTALQQIFSKGKLSAEELRQQLGERLPGVFEVAQQALKDQFPDLNKAMAEGKVGAEQLILIAQKYREIVQGQLPSATESLAASQARLTNVVNDFKLAVADAGFADAYAAAIKRISEFIASPDGQDAAKNLAGAFESVLEIIVLLVENFDALSAVVTAFIGINIARSLTGMAQNLLDVKDAAKGAATELKFLQKAFLVLSAAIIGWEIGTYLREKFAAVRVFGVLMVTSLDRAWTQIKYGAQIAFEEIPRYVTNAAIAVENGFNDMIRRVGRVLQSFLNTIGNTKLASAVGQMIDKVTDTEYQKQTDRAKKLKDDLQAELTKIAQIEQDMINDAVRTDGVKLADRKGATKFPGKGAGGANTGPTEAELAKRQRLIESLQDRLDALDARINRASSQTLENQLSAVDLQTNALKADIEKIADKGVRQAFLDRLSRLRGELRQQIQTNFSDEILKEENALQTKLEQAEAAAGRKSKDNLDKRLAAIDQSYADTFRDIDKLMLKQFNNNIDTSGTTQKKEELQQIIQVQKGLVARSYYEEQINALIEQRKTQIDAVAAEEKNGQINRIEAEQKVSDIIASTSPLIEKVKNDGIAWAQANKEVFASPELQQQFIATLTAAADKATVAKNQFAIMGDALEGTVGAAFDSLSNNLDAIVTGQKSIGDGFRDMGAAALKFFADFMRRIIMAIAEMYVLRALQAAMGMGGAAAGGATATAGTASIPANVAHTGGVVGSLSRSRGAAAEWFASAPRYHTGGIVGLAPNEYPAILQKNEEVLKASDPRNILNGGAGGGSQSSDQAGTRFVLVDDRSKVAEAMASADGEQVIVQHIRRNAATIKQILG